MPPGDTFDPGRYIEFYKSLYVFPLHRAIYRMDRHAALNQPKYGFFTEYLGVITKGRMMYSVPSVASRSERVPGG